jgi:uncharacterized membrane protein
MSERGMAVLLGGLLPALCFGASSVLMKLSARAGIGLPAYVLSLAAGVAVYGALTAITQPGLRATNRGVLYALLVGLTWAVGMALIQLALTRYRAAISQIVPLHMLNLVVTIAFGFFLFAEAHDLDSPRLLLGAVLMGIGAFLVAGA